MVLGVPVCKLFRIYLFSCKIEVLKSGGVEGIHVCGFEEGMGRG